jgi:hypothetical protein
LLKGNGKLAFVSLPLVRAARSRAASDTGAVRALDAVFDMNPEYGESKRKKDKKGRVAHTSNRLVTHLCYLHVPVRDGGETHLLIGFFKPMGGG